MNIKKNYFIKKDFLWIILFSIILLSFDYFHYSGTDYGVYFNNGRLITKGMLPYVDFWDHKTPGIYYYLALWQLIFGSSFLSAKISLAPIYILWGISLYYFCYVLFQNRKLALGTSLIGLYFSLRMGFDPFRNGAILILSTSIELIVLTIIHHIFRNNVRSTPLYVMVGFLAFGAFLTRQTSITPFIIAALILISFLFSRKDDKKLLFSVYFFLGAFIFLIFIWGLIVKFQIPYSEIYKNIIHYNKLYINSYNNSFALSWLINISLDYFWWMIIIVIGITLIKKKSDYQNDKVNKSALYYVLLCLIISLLLTISSIHVQPYYKIQYSPYLIISSCYLLFVFYENFRNSKFKKSMLLIIILIGLLPNIWLTTVTDLFALNSYILTIKESNYSIQNFPDQLVVSEIDGLSSSSEPSIFIYGNRSWIYLLSNSVSVNKYYYSNSIFRKGYLSDYEFEFFLNEMEETPPELLIVWPNHPLITDELNNSNYIIEFEDFIRNNYTLVKEIRYQKIEQLKETIKIYTLDIK